MKWDAAIAAAKEYGSVELAKGHRLVEVRYMARKGDKPGDSPAWEVNSFFGLQLRSTAWPYDDAALVRYLDAQASPPSVLAVGEESPPWVGTLPSKKGR